jgi:hypothetical protein
VSIRKAASTRGMAIATASTGVLVLLLVTTEEGLDAIGVAVEGVEVDVTATVTVDVGENVDTLTCSPVMFP